MTPKEILHQYWGHASFRPLQEEIIRSVLTGKDTLAILPTGGGKSVCFQVPALVMDGLCLVISPLIALMQDQLQQLKQKGIPAASLHTGMGQDELRSVLRQAVAGEYKFLYVSPERLKTNAFRDYLPYLPLNLIAVDEAHCISQWGYDFRPSYLEIAAVRKVKKNLPVIALTASATEEVQQDITEKLSLRGPVCFRQSFERPNLSYSVILVESRSARLVTILKKVQGSSIVYCRTRKKTKEYSALLQREGISASCYHAGLDRADRKERQEKWISNEIRVMVCTNAFGMGIDKPDVRLVIHTAPPDCLENYYQEAGRAGRDGKKSYAVQLYLVKDLEELAGMPEMRYPPMSTIRKVYQAIANYLQLPSGIGEDNSYPLDIQDLAERFKLPILEIIHSLKAMQQGGILDYQEQLFLPPNVQCLAQRDQLFEFEKMHPELEPMLKALLRSYGGIFEHPIMISERQLGGILKKSAVAVREDLLKLNARGIIRYQPQRDTPHIRYLQDRVKAEDLYIEPISYLKRKSTYTERVRDMLAYMTGKSCRAQFIGRYFGDTEIRPCGICDNCVEMKKSPFTTRDYRDIADLLEAALKENDYSAKELETLLKPSDHERFWRVLDHWEAEGKIEMTKDGKVKMRN
jgi:ATP-dependent DNA helicase RecQ